MKLQDNQSQLLTAYEYEVIVVNTNPEDYLTYEVVSYFNKRCNNVKLIQVYDERAKTIKNATFPINLGARQYAKGELLLIAVDAARIPTSGVLRKTRDQFERWGDNIVTTTMPYHFLKHSSTPGFTVEECREAFLKTRWKKDIYHLFAYKAHTNISKSGVFNESTWLGVTKENFLKAGGHNETSHHGWSDYNLCLFRRLTRPKPKDGIQIPGSEGNDHWNKIGLGLKIHVLEGEADFHIHHELSDAPRDFNILKQTRIKSWNQFLQQEDCIVANKNLPWGEGDSEEIIL